VIRQRFKSWRYPERRSSPSSVRYSGRYCLLTMFLAVILVMVLDIWLLWSWGNGQIAFLWVFVMHCLASSLFLMQSLTCWWLRRAWGFGLLTFPLVLVLGPIGAIGILFTALVFVFSRESATPFDVWYEEIFPEEMTPPEEKMIEHLLIWAHEAEAQHHNLMPFSDILVSGSVKEKQSAIDIMVKNYHPSFAAVLRSALNDPTNTIRAHAVAAITRIEEMYQNKTFLLERRMVERPNDLENIFNLAKHYDEHAHAGLSDADTLVEHRLQAERLYHQLHDSMGATNASVFWLLGRLLLRDERNAEALLVFEEALEMSADVAVPQQRIWYWECLYNLRYFAKLREQVCAHYEQVTSHPDLPQPQLDSIELWAGDDVQFTAIMK